MESGCGWLSQGTKGKGSVAAIVATALRAAGLRVGVYTSPHGEARTPLWSAWRR